MNWRELKADIEQETDTIWLNEPEELYRIRHGIGSSGAGSFGQYFSTLVFANVYTVTLGNHILYPLLHACEDPDISLDVLKKMTHYSLFSGLQPALLLSHVSTPKVNEFAQGIATVLPEISSKDEYRELVGAFKLYINILQYWALIVFPWHIGKLFPSMPVEKLKELLTLADADKQE